MDERLREREKGEGGNEFGMYQKRWANHDYHEKNGESIAMVQARNIEALKEILKNNDGQNIVIGTHGTALSSIINYYKPDWMPYILEMDFERLQLVSMTEHDHVEKEFKGAKRADKI